MADDDDRITNYNTVKDTVIEKLVSEGLISKNDGNEFCERCQVIVYKPSWFSKIWRNKNHPELSEHDKNFFKIVEMRDKQTKLEDILR